MAREIKPLGIVSFRDLAYRLGVETDLLQSVAAIAGAYHSPFESTNSPRPFQRKPFIQKSRCIDNPTDILKKVQSLINVKLLRKVDLPDHVFGGRKGCSVIQNAKEHVGSKVLVTIDVKQFFPSINNLEVYSVWVHMLGCSPRVAALLTRLTTFERRLPQGAPTSTALANLVLLSCDASIRTFCAERGIRYTSWVDDLAFSGKNARAVIRIAAEALRQRRLRISRGKVKIMSAGNRQVLMGLVVNKRLGVTKEYRQATRSAIHKLRTGHISPDEIPAYLRSIRGKIAYIDQTNSCQAAKLRNELDKTIKQ